VSTALICPICGVQAVARLDQRTRQIELTYDHHARARQCEHPNADSMANCPNMRPIMRLLLTQLRRPGDGTDPEFVRLDL
jgi:hypothetical protein